MTIEAVISPAPDATKRRRWLSPARLAIPASVAAGAAGFWMPNVTELGQMYLVFDAALLGMFALSIAWLVSRTGQLSLGHAAFYGVGAYAVAIATTRWGWSLNQALLAAVLASSIAGVLVGCIAVRMSGLGFAMVTLAFGQALYLLSMQEFMHDWTGGESGYLTTNSDSLLWVSRSDLDAPGLWSVVWACVLLVTIGLALLNRSRFGTLLSAIKDNEERVRFSGFRTYLPQLVGFVTSASIAGLAGALYAINAGFVSPSNLFWMTCAIAIIAALVGGVHTIVGPFVGAVVYLYAVDRLSQNGHVELYLGIGLIAVIVLAPLGIVGSLRPLVKWIDTVRKNGVHR